MKEFLKSILKAVGCYYPLQGYYRRKLFKIKSKKIYREYKQYKGEGFVCNICGTSYRKFAPDYPKEQNKAAIEKYKMIAGYGENVFCPSCMSRARERLVVAMLAEVDLFGKKVLHFSPEKNVLAWIQHQTQPVTVDLFPEFYEYLDKNIQKADATQLSFADDSFDLVIGNHIMEHIPDDRKAMKEIYRVLKPGGQAILQVPFSTDITTTIEEPGINDPKRQSALFGQQDHVRIYQLEDYLDRLRKTGFKVDYLPYELLSHLHINAIQPGEGFIMIRK
jgi:SAM-dependent methyltransferase